MKYRASRKVGWIWTRQQGWKRVPLRLRRVKKVPMPTKHRTRKLFMVMKPVEPKAKKPHLRHPPSPRLLGTEGSGGQTEAPEMAAGQGRAVSAPKLAPKPENLAQRQIRRVWSGKYDELTPPEARP